jgi:hypothetical protein
MGRGKPGMEYRVCRRCRIELDGEGEAKQVVVGRES